MITPDIDALIEAALEEDMPRGDITSENVIPRDSVSRADVLAKEPGVLAGIHVARRVFEKMDRSLKFDIKVQDGKSFKKGTVLASVQGRSISILKGERTALNFLQRLSGIATTTRTYVDALKGTKAKILDTRKTTPGLRVLEKYAVRMGGGVNHRLNLSEMVLIKDNHLAIVGSIAFAVARAKRAAEPGVKVEVEVTNFDQARQALEAGADWIMLDNMSSTVMRKIVSWVAGRVPLEASGGVGLQDVRRIARLGVDFISVGRLTHSFHSIDISLEFKR